MAQLTGGGDMPGLCKVLLEQLLCQAGDGEAITVKGDKQVVEARNENAFELGMLCIHAAPACSGWVVNELICLVRESAPSSRLVCGA